MPRDAAEMDLAATLGTATSMLLGGRCPGCGTTTAAIPCARCCRELWMRAAAPGAVWHDGGSIGRLVRAGKHGTWRGAGAFLARAAVTRPGAIPGDVDIVTWVPADRTRRAQRGGHLPERFARA